MTEFSTVLRQLRERIASVVGYSVVSLGFYLMSLLIPPFMSGVTIPGLPPPFSNMDWLVWGFLFLLSFAFAATALYNLLQAIDPLFVIVSKRLGSATEPGKRVARDLAYALLIVLIATALSPFVERLGSIGPPLKVLVGLGTLGFLVFLLYDAAKTVYMFFKVKVEEIVSRLVR